MSLSDEIHLSTACPHGQPQDRFMAQGGQINQNPVMKWPLGRPEAWILTTKDIFINLNLFQPNSINFEFTDFIYFIQSLENIYTQVILVLDKRKTLTKHVHVNNNNIHSQIL